MYYSRILQTEDPQGHCFIEFFAFDILSRQEAQRLATEDLSERIIAIEDECRTLQAQSKPRYTIWLIPPT